MLCDITVNIIWKFIQYRIHWHKTRMLKKTSLTQNKMNSFFIREFQLISVLLLISSLSWSTRFVSLIACVGSIFDSVSFLLKFISFLFNKKHGLFDFKGVLFDLRQFLITESSLKMMKNAFYFTLKAIFVLKIFTFLSWLFGHVEKTARLER